MRSEAKAIIEMAQFYMRCDEALKALWILDNPPAFMREPFDADLLNAKNHILSHTNARGWDLKKESYFDESVQPMSQMFFNWLLLKSETEDLRIKTHTTWVNQGLSEFVDTTKFVDNKNPNVFVSFNELPFYKDVDEFIQNKLNYVDYKYIWVSVPKYVSEIPIPTYEEKQVFAWRGYTVQDFNDFCIKQLPQYSFEIIDGGRHIIGIGTRR